MTHKTIKGPDMSYHQGKDLPIFGIPMRNGEIDLVKWLDLDKKFNR